MLKKSLKRAVRVLIPAILLIAGGCATDKDAWLNRNYNSMTTRFNGYFNGNESFKEGVAQIERMHKDDYDHILPVFKYGDQTVASSSFSYMDVAIEKASVQIQKRTMFIRGKERNRWIDNCWMLIGKAHFYKMEYDRALQNFNFVIARFPNKQSRYEAMLWKARTNNQTQRFSDNEALLGMLQRSIDVGEVSRKIRRTLPLVQADFFIQQGNYRAAIPHLKKAIRLNWNRQVRARTMFILAQIYQSIDKCEEASPLFRKVARRSNDYEMTFNAKINMARCFRLDNGDSRTIKRYLAKMIRNENNADYLDQIYFALAEVYMKKNDDKAAIENLRLSVAKSTTNQNQKAISSLALADLYFKHENYPYAQAYYDSAVTYLQKDYPTYDELMKRHDVLSRLVNNIMIVHTQDSLQHLAQLSENERMSIINGIIAEIVKREQEERARERESEGQFRNMGFLEMESRQRQRQQQATSEWYFDNPATRSFGYTEFKNKWGERPLADMWRISARSDPTYHMTEEELVADSLRRDSLKMVASSMKDPEFYLRNIPLTPEAMDVSNKKIERALYNMGYIYFHELNDEDNSIESFGKQIKRFPEGKQKPPAYYQLHQIYNHLNFADKAEKYKQLLISEFPEHEYARILADPDYFVNRAKEQDMNKEYYARTYHLYKNGQFQEAKENVDSALSSNRFTNIHPRFSLLNAFIVGNIDGLANYKQALEITALGHHGTPEAEFAQKLLNALKRDSAKSEEVEKDLSAIDYSIYSYSASRPHLALLIIDTKFGRPERVQIALSDFNRSSFSSRNLNLTSTVLSEHMQMITVSSFPNAKEAMIYYNALKTAGVFSGDDAEGQSAIFIMTSDNYPVFFKDKDVDKYQAFFNDHYKVKK